LLVLCSELSWPLDIAPNAHNIGLLAIQTSTPRTADSMPPPLKTPATDFNPYVRVSAAVEQPQVLHYQRNEAEGNQQLEGHPNQFAPQPHGWSDENDEKNYILEDTVREADLDREEDDKTQYLCVDDEGCEHFANVVGYDVDPQSRYPELHNGQTVVDQAQPVHSGPVEREFQSQMFAFLQPQQNEYGQMFADHRWNQEMYELEREDVTDVGQLETADSRNFYSDNVQIHHPYADDHRGVNVAGQLQRPAAATFPQAVSDAAEPVSVGMSAAFEHNMLSTWPMTHAKVAPREASSRSPTKVASKGDSDFSGYRVQYKQQGRDQIHTVSAAGDGYQKVTAEQADSQTAVAKTVPERLQQAFLHTGKFSLELHFHICCYSCHFVSELFHISSQFLRRMLVYFYYVYPGPCSDSCNCGLS